MATLHSSKRMRYKILKCKTLLQKRIAHVHISALVSDDDGHELIGPSAFARRILSVSSATVWARICRLASEGSLGVSGAAAVLNDIPQLHLQVLDALGVVPSLLMSFLSFMMMPIIFH